MKIIVGLMLGVAVAASADTGDRNYLHHGVLERTLVGAAMKNPATWYARGAGVENAFIAMTAEEVEITLHAERAEVAATFYFENTAAEARDVEMCFPVTYGMLGVDSYAARDEEFSVAGLKTDLAVAVDGAAAPYALEDTSDVWEFPALANWAVHFDAGGKRRVVCHYTDDYNGYGGSLDLSVVYILYTGATWKGPIGKGTITVRPGDDFDWSVPLYYLGAGVPPARDEGDRIVWDFENLEPAFKAEISGVPDDSSSYKYARDMNGAAVTVGFAKARSLAETFVVDEPYTCPPGVGAAAGVLVDGLSFRTAPDAGAPRVVGNETLAKGEGVAVLERRRDWYKVRVAGDAEGWVRWRSVDAASGAETICVELILSSGD